MEKPPKTIPPELLNDYSLNGKIPIYYEHYYDQSHEPDNPMRWSSDQIDSYLRCAETKKIAGYHDDKFLYPGLDKYHSLIANKDVAVIGSDKPCYEAILLAYQAHPVTIEYGTIICDDPRLSIFTVKEFEKNPRIFDAILSVSSIEHDGLGRYGDPIDPNADLKFMDRAIHLIPKNGLFFLQVPVGMDRVSFNDRRVYGRIRLPLLLKSWNIIDTFGFSNELLDTWDGGQPLFILTPNIPNMLQKSVFAGVGSQ